MMKTLKQIKSVKHILPITMVLLTRKNRYLPEIKWSENSWTYNLFRVYELIFWRRHGIKHEMSASRSANGTTMYACHSWEAVFCMFEWQLREMFRWKFPYKISIPLVKTTTGFEMFSSPYLFAIALDTSADGGNASTSPATISYTVTGSNPLLWVANQPTTNATDLVSAVSYNAQALSTANTNGLNPMYKQTTGIACDLWGKANPSTGTHNVIVTFTAANTSTMIASYSGCLQTAVGSAGQPDAAGGNTGTSVGTLTQSITVVASNCWIIGFGAGSAGNVSAGTGMTQRQKNAGFGNILGDSNGTVATGSQSMTITSGTQSLAMIIASFAPTAVVSTNSNLLIFM